MEKITTGYQRICNETKLEMPETDQVLFTITLKYAHNVLNVH